MIPNINKLLQKIDGGHGLAGGAGLAFILRVAGAGLGLALSVAIARTLGAEQTGLYFLGLTVVGAATIFARLGLENALLRLISISAGNGEWTRVKALALRSLGYAGVASLVVTVLLYWAAPMVAQGIFQKPELTVPLQWLTLTILPMAGVVLYGEMLKALGRIRDSQIIQSVITPLVSLVLFTTVFSTSGLMGAIDALLIAVGLSCLLAAWLWHARTPQLQGIATSAPPPFLRMALPFMSIQAMNILNDSADMLILGMFAPAEEVGIYAIAKRFTVIIAFILIAVNSVASPKFARLHAQGDMVGLAKLAAHSARLGLLTSGPLLLVCLVAPEWLMSLFGEQFEQGWLVLFILTIGQVVNIMSGSVGQLLAMSGNEKTLHNVLLISMISNITLMITLTQYFGMIGAAVSSALTNVLSNALCIFYVKKRLGIMTHALSI